MSFGKFPLVQYQVLLDPVMYANNTDQFYASMQGNEEILFNSENVK